jgi:hypothetical protein
MVPKWARAEWVGRHEGRRRRVRRALLVLGMHRSGTSALTGLIVRLGVDAPRTLHPPNEWNPLGYWESEPILEFHDRLLRATGTSWDAWTPLNASLAAVPFTSELTRLVAAEFGSAPIFVVKDPRMCRLVPFWLSTLEAADVEPAAILMVRDPVEVSRSLAARDRLPAEFSLLMWLRHMLDAEHATRGLSRSIVSYRELLTDWRAVARRIADDLHITWPCSPDAAGEAIAQFVKPDLRHHVSDTSDVHAGPPIDRWIMQACDALDQLRCGDAAKTAAGLVVLDEVRRQVDEAGLIFGRADEAVRVNTIMRLEQVDTDRQALRHHAVALEADRSRLRDHIADLEAEQRQRQVLAEEAQRRAADREAELARVQHEAASLRAECAVLGEHASHLQQTHHQLAGELVATRHHVKALLSSGSWRITAPLRALVRVARRATGRKDAPAAD